MSKNHLKINTTVHLKGQTPARLREAVPSDAPEVLRYLQRVSGESDFLTFGPDELPMDLFQETQMLENSRAADNCLILLGEVGGNLAGVCSLAGKKRPRIRHAADLGLSVLKHCQNQGLGRAMLEIAIQWARGSGALRKINLKVRADNQKAADLYERLGFVKEGLATREFWISGRFFDCIVMGLSIDPPDNGRGGPS